jgi:hypothetical protein
MTTKKPVRENGRQDGNQAAERLPRSFKLGNGETVQLEIVEHPQYIESLFRGGECPTQFIDPRDAARLRDWVASIWRLYASDPRPMFIPKVEGFHHRREFFWRRRSGALARTRFPHHQSIPAPASGED